MSDASSSTPMLPEAALDTAPAPESESARASGRSAAAKSAVGASAEAAEVSWRPRTVALLLVTALAPALLLLAYDSITRREIFVDRAGPPIGGYIGSAVLSLAIWGLALEAARHPRRVVRIGSWVVLGLTATFGVGGQLVFHATTHGYFNRDAAIFSLNRWPTILDWLLLNPIGTATLMFGPAAVVVGYAAARHRRLGSRRQLPGIAAFLGVAVWLFAAFGPFKVPANRHGMPPDILFWHAAGGLGMYSVGLANRPRQLPFGHHMALPPSRQPAAAGAPDIVLIFGESVRRDEVCANRSPDCTKSPQVDLAAPDRIGFERSFAVSSCTEISSAILWSGLSIHTSPEALQVAPLVWDYAKARGYHTAYHSSQNLSFQDQGLFLESSRIDEKREARDRIEHVDLDIGSPDEESAEEALAFLQREGPALSVVHFSNTHLPYRQVQGHAPHAHNGVDDASRQARYLNSLVHQDAVIASFVRRLRETERGKKAVVIYHADHGEAWGEHGSYSHSFDLYAEQVAVPLWIDAPEGSISGTQRAELRAAAASRGVFTADVTATVLDLLGALDDPAFAEQRKSLAGASVLSALPGPRDMDISNCPPFRGCYPDAWGLVRWPLKYHWVGRATESVCTDLEADPLERAPLAQDRCEQLRADVASRQGITAGAPAASSARSGTSGSP